MQIVKVGINRGEVGERWSLPDGTFTDLVWVHSLRDDHLEHLKVRAAPDRIDIVLFLGVPHRNCAEEIARAICVRVVEFVPGLRGWLPGVPPTTSRS